MVVEQWFDEVVEARSPLGYGGRFYGVYPALVTDIKDPEGQGRVKISLPWSPDGSGSSYEAWARIATLMAGKNRGTWFIPDVNDEVMVVFMGGSPRAPCVIGAVWNGVDTPPQNMDRAGKNNIKQIRSRNGILITLDDRDGQETLILETPGGQKATLKDGPGTIELLDSSGNMIKMEAGSITVTGPTKVVINAGTTAEISTGMLTVNAGMSKFSGVVQADTVITSSVISASYTPGAGNIW